MKATFPIVLALFGCLNLQVSAQTIVPTQTDEIIIDNGASGKADPNDRIRYKVTIQNTGGASGTGVQLNAVPDPRTTFVPGSFRSSPLAVNDSYTATGNVGITVPAANGVKSNDFDDNLAIATLTVSTPPVNGAVTLNNDGSFTYSPNAGFTGTDNFSYTLTDGNPVGLPVPLTDVATVTITVSNMIWFVDNSVPSTGTGILTNPFKTLGDFNGSAGPLAGHVVFVKNTGTKYNGGIVLKNNMQLFGTGTSGGATLADVLPFSLAPNSKALPAINGVKPIIIGPLHGIALASGNTVRGVEVGYCPGGSKIFGNNFGALTIGNSAAPDVVLSGNRQVLNLTNGSFVSSSKISSINSLDTSNITLNTVSGTLAVGSTTVNANQSLKAIDIQNSSAALDFGTTTANQFNGGTVISITSSGTGSVTFGSLNIPNLGNGVGLIASTGGTINIGGTSNAITARTALDITNTSFGSGATFAAITSTNSGGKGVNLDNVTGSVIINGGSITNSGGIAFDLNAGSSTVTYAGTISNANRAVEVTVRTGGAVTFSGNITNTGTGINVASNAGGTINFSGSSKSLNTGANTAVTLAANTGATINFSNGGLSITTTSGTGLNATGGGTVIVTGTANTINSGTGTALNVANTTIGASNLNFQSISANGGTNGIVLNSTGASGGLTVTGTGAANSGGTIQNTTGDAISATNTRNLSLYWILIQSPVGDGINAMNLSGTCLLSNSTIQDFDANRTATKDGYRIVNTGTTSLTLLTITGTTFNGTTSDMVNPGSNHGVFMEAQGSGNMTLSIEGSCVFTEMFGDAVQVSGITGATSNVNVTIKNSNFTNAAVLGNGGISLTPFGSINLTAIIDNNNLNDIMRPVTNLGAIGGTNGLTAIANITIINNTLNNIVGSRGITFSADGSGLSTLFIDNNNIDRLGSTTKYAIQVNMIGTPGGVSSPGKVTVTNNNIGQAANHWTSGNGTAEAIFFLTQNSSTMQTLVSGNIVTANATLEVIRARSIGSSAQNITLTGNTVTDSTSPHVGELAARTEGTATLCFNASGNTLPGGGTGVILLTETAGAMNVTQASQAALSTANSSATVTLSGSPSFGQPACILP